MPNDLRPYLVLASYEFIVDRGDTPYLTVLVDDRCQVPFQYVRDLPTQEGGTVPAITLNISMTATPNLMIPKEGNALTFSGSFDGRKMEVFVPFDCVLAIFSKESPNHAMGFDYVSPEQRAFMEQSLNEEVPEPPKASGKPNLKVIK